MRPERLPRRALVRWYTAAVALVCGGAITLIVHDLPASRAAAPRQTAATTWESRLASTRARIVAVHVARVRLRAAYNRLVLESRAREQRLLAGVRHWRRVAAAR